MTIKAETKFEFGVDFQEAILNFIICDKLGYKAISLVSEDYFVVLHHAIIFKAVKNFFKQKHRIPSLSILKEKLRRLYETREFSKALLKQDIEDIDLLVNRVYNTNPKDGDEILDNIIRFAQFTALQEVQDSQDLLDFNSYTAYSEKIKKAISIGSEMSEDTGIFLVEGAKDRMMQRSLGLEVNPTPFWQVNRWLNGGGLEKHSVIMFMSEAKRFKTGTMVNWGLKELGRRKRGVYIDLENGQMAIATRGDQSVINANKKEILQGLKDEALAKLYRKYKRIKAELVIKRFGAFKTTVRELGNWMDRLKLEKGIVPTYAIVDFPDLMGALSGRSDDDKRISDVYIDLKNFAVEYDLDYVIAATHVNRDASKAHRNETKFVAEDVAKCIDKIRHCDLVIGLQENPEETEAGVLRWEIIEQRDGVREGKALFWADVENQKLKEFTKQEVKEYYEQLGTQDVATKKKTKTSTERKSDI